MVSSSSSSSSTAAPYHSPVKKRQADSESALPPSLVPPAVSQDQLQLSSRKRALEDPEAIEKRRNRYWGDEMNNKAQKINDEYSQKLLDEGLDSLTISEKSELLPAVLQDQFPLSSRKSALALEDPDELAKIEKQRQRYKRVKLDRSLEESLDNYHHQQHIQDCLGNLTISEKSEQPPV